MRQAGNLVEMMGVRQVEFESPAWRQDGTFRGWPKFGVRVYRIK